MRILIDTDLKTVELKEPVILSELVSFLRDGFKDWRDYTVISSKEYTPPPMQPFYPYYPWVSYTTGDDTYKQLANDIDVSQIHNDFWDDRIVSATPEPIVKPGASTEYKWKK